MKNLEETVNRICPFIKSCKLEKYDSCYTDATTVTIQSDGTWASQTLHAYGYIQEVII